MNRSKISKFANKTVRHLRKKASKTDSDSQKKIYTQTAKAHESFLEKFESTSGDTTNEILDASQARKEKGMWAAGIGAAIGPAVIAGSMAGVLPFLALPAFVGCVVGLGIGVTAMALVEHNELKFSSQVESFKHDVKHDKKPSLSSGAVSDSWSDNWDSDDEIGTLGISASGGVGIKTGGGLMIGMDGKVGFALL